MRSKNLHVAGIGNKDTDLSVVSYQLPVLSPLWIGVVLADFHKVGIFPVLRNTGS